MFCNNNFICFGILISIIVGAIVGVLFAFGFIPFITTVTWIFFGLSVLILTLLILGLFLGAVTVPNALTRCFCRNSSLLFAGVFGTLITSIIALAIVLAPAVISVITLVAIMGFFFSLMILGLICFISCIINEL